MADIGEVGESLSQAMYMAYKANGQANANEAARLERAAAVQTIANSLRNIMVAAGVLGEEYAEDALSVAHARHTMAEATDGLRRTDINRDTRKPAEGLLRNTYKPSLHPEQLMGAHASLNAAGLALKTITRGLKPLTDAANEALRHADRIEPCLNEAQQSTQEACGIITDYADRTGIPVQNPYS
jgi:predicted exporter